MTHPNLIITIRHQIRQSIACFRKMMEPSSSLKVFKRGIIWFQSVIFAFVVEVPALLPSEGRGPRHCGRIACDFVNSDRRRCGRVEFSNEEIVDMHAVVSVVSVGAIHIETHHDVLVGIILEVVCKGGAMRCEAFNFGISICVVSPSFKFGPCQAMVGRDERKDARVVLRARGNWRQEA